MTKRRFCALTALVTGGASLAIAVWVAIAELPLGLFVVACLVGTVAGLATGLMHRGATRVAGFVVGAAALFATLALIAIEGRPVLNALVLGLAAIAVGAARSAFLIRSRLPAVAAPEHPVLIYNPRSGGDKATEHSLPAEARARDIEAIELRRGDDLRLLAEAAVERGADALAMAGGDGSQAIVAAVAAEHGLPYACVPAGTRNHFALDLGVDRDDVVGGLDALVDGDERVVDLGEVNGRVFVNNVSLGLYAEAVQRSGYREAKIRTLLDVLPAAVAAGSEGAAIRWTGPDGDRRHAAAAVLVSNNPYRLGSLIGSGTRPRIDGGELGIVAIGPLSELAGGPGIRPRWEEWTAAELRIDADEPVAAGIDGETATLEPPLRFRIRPGALRVRVSRDHPGESPSAAAPRGVADAVRTLVAVALGKA